MSASDLPAISETTLSRDEGFAARVREDVAAGYRRVTYLGIALMLGFGVLDIISVHDPGLVAKFFAMRLALALVMIALLKLSQRPAYQRYVESICGLAMYLIGSFMGLMSALNLGHKSHYYAGITLTLIAVGVFVPIGPLHVLVTSTAVYFTFVALLFALDPVPLAEWDWTVFAANSIFLISTATTVTVGAYFNRRLRRRLFDAAFAQQQTNEELRSVYERITHSYQEVSEKNREIEEAYRAKSQFLDNMSHELRTPLTCILTPLEGLLAGNARGEVRQVFEDMHTATRQLYDLINDLLDYSKYGARDQPLARDPVDLRAVVDEHVKAFGSTARQRKLVLQWEPPPEPVVVLGSPRELGKVARNLISNAVKFTPAGGRVTVDVAVVGERVRLSVRDTGIGMNESIKAKLFTPFFQGDATSTRAFEGTGIGLALVKTIVNRHDGEVVVESSPGRGTTMTVELPSRPLDPTELVGMAPAQPAPGESMLAIPVPEDILGAPAMSMTRIERLPPIERVELLDPAAPTPDLSFPGIAPLLGEHLLAAQGERSRILVIDDHPEIVRVIERLLAPQHDVYTASNGEEGLQKVRDVRPALVISDVMMPKLSGFQLVEQLRKNPETERLPVLLLTARADGRDRIRGLRRGASDYLVKPFLPEELKARVSNLLRAQHYESYLTRLNEELATKSSSLETRVHGFFIDTVRTLVAAIDAKDFYTGGHSERVSYFAVRIAEHMKLARPLLRTIELGALLHDVGKIGIPDKVLNKPGALSLEEIEVIRQHTVLGGKILEKSPELAELRRFALHHHERWDGAGYPDRLRGDDIPPSVRVVSVADCWDAMVSDRIYRSGMEPRIAAEKVSKLGGSQFDPAVVEAMMEIWPELELPPNLRPLKPRTSPVENRQGPRVSECGEVYEVHN
ncbi:HD domain-containing phosphohydrolase [Nannocystis sp. SCPEA4]|uniref:HD domain-containing phosphohydrolase n=1 Tax=Nannocystis sp. SCPEA4 TaxID=2996787 RepID=UPI00226E808E|nr:HD domain-containing phosphohydrolase [Nannocystis sp. SCPEA4]MCY1061865.1 ATP-binding protein [Nannocystis sp. SCPEA4]